VLLNDFNYAVRKTLAENLIKLNVEKTEFIDELLQDEEREVV
jgi:hypothetical protein